MEGQHGPRPKRLCVFYKNAEKFTSLPRRKLEWIVCQKCQRAIRTGRLKIGNRVYAC